MARSLNHITDILLLSTDHDVTMPVLRALGSVLPRHITLSIVSTTKRYCFPQFSRFIHRHYPLNLNDEDDCTDQLLHLKNRSRSTLLLPLDEFFIRLLSLNKDKLSRDFYLPPLPSTQVFDTLVYKCSLNKLLLTQGLPAPKTYKPDLYTIHQIEDDDFPLILKPVRGSAGRGIKKFMNKKSLLLALPSLNVQKYLLQEFIPGKDIDCSLLAMGGEIKALTVQRGLESRGFSFSTAIKFEQNKKVRELTEKIIKHTGYSGVAHLDFRMDSRDDQLKLIDFNARFWLSLLGSKAAGINFAYLYCLAALKIPFEQPDFQEVNYMMGKSTFNYYYSKAFNNSPKTTDTTYTDLIGRIKDPLPELFKFMFSGLHKT